MTTSSVEPPGPPSSRRRRSSLAVGFAATLSVCLLALAAGLGAISAIADTTPLPPYTVSVAQTTALTDGTPVPVQVTSSDPANNPVGWVDIELCRPGVDYSSYDVVRTRGNCGFSPGSSAFASPTGSATKDFPGQPSGASSFPVNFIAGVGVATFAGSSLTCDPNNPCDLVVSIFTSQAQSFGTTAHAVAAFPLSFLPFGGVAGCSGTAPNAVQTVSSDRLVESYADWSRQACTSAGPGGGQAPTQNTYVSEGGPFGAVDSFATGNADMAYAAGGYGLPGFSEPTGRPYVAVPLALNAAVVASSGGQLVPGYTPPKTPPVTFPAPFANLALTAGQAASLFGGGYVSPAQATAIDRQNPELTKGAQIVPYSAPGSSTFVYPEAVAGTNATTVFDTTYFTTVAAPDWNSGPYAPAGQTPFSPRGVLSSFAQPAGSEAPFSAAGLYSHRSDLEKAALPYVGQGPLPLWVLTDRATATQLGLTVASLASDASGATFSAPTAATMDAALPTMTAQPDGTLLPNPTAAQGGTSPAYPLTFVEYALVPTEPLVDASCTPRPTAQKLMTSWLTFLTGPGQDNLAPGLEKLPPSLQQEATAAIAKVGTAAQTGACGPGATPPVTPTGAPTAINTGPPSLGLPSFGLPSGLGGSLGPSAGPQGSPTGAAPNGTRPGAGRPTVSAQGKLASVKIPGFAGRKRPPWALPAVALAGLGLLTGGAALRSSGWSPPLPFAGVGDRLRGLRRRSRRP